MPDGGAGEARAALHPARPRAAKTLRQCASLKHVDTAEPQTAGRDAAMSNDNSRRVPVVVQSSSDTRLMLLCHAACKNCTQAARQRHQALMSVVEGASALSTRPTVAQARPQGVLQSRPAAARANSARARLLLYPCRSLSC